MLKAKLSLAAILSTTAIASGIVLASVSSAQSCPLRRYEKATWLSSPWVAIITLPGIAIATALSVGDRLYKKDSRPGWRK